MNTSEEGRLRYVAMCEDDRRARFRTCFPQIAEDLDRIERELAEGHELLSRLHACAVSYELLPGVCDAVAKIFTPVRFAHLAVLRKAYAKFCELETPVIMVRYESEARDLAPTVDGQLASLGKQPKGDT